MICTWIDKVDGGAILVYERYFKWLESKQKTDLNLTRLSDVFMWQYLICSTSIIVAIWCVNYFKSHVMDTSKCEALRLYEDLGNNDIFLHCAVYPEMSQHLRLDKSRCLMR